MQTINSKRNIIIIIYHNVKFKYRYIYIIEIIYHINDKLYKIMQTINKERNIIIIIYHIVLYANINSHTIQFSTLSLHYTLLDLWLATFKIRFSIRCTCYSPVQLSCNSICLH